MKPCEGFQPGERGKRALAEVKQYGPKFLYTVLRES